MRTWSRVLALALSAVGVLVALPSEAATMYVLRADGKLATVPTTNVPAMTAGVAITGLAAGDTLVAIDVRPQTQRLYALGVNAAANTATLYHLSPETGFAAIVGAGGGLISFTTDGSTAVDFPDPAVVQWDIDFNPAADRLRVIAGNLNFRVNQSTGLPVDGDNGGAVGSVTGINPDGATNTGTTIVDGAAYTNNQPNNGAITTLYTLDATSNSLFIQNAPNAGAQTLGQTVTLNGAALEFTNTLGFDILPGVNAASSNAAVANGSGLAALTVSGVTSLYTIKLSNATANNLGTFPAAVRSVAFRTELNPAIAMNSAGDSLLRFDVQTPGTVTTQAVGAPNAGETLVGMDFRPQTGQFYALGINATANTGTLYQLDPQTGAVAAIGTPGQVAFTTDGATAVDFPDPTASGYGVDFNPAVDRLRVTTSTGLNFRVNQLTGGAVDGNNGLVSAVTGTNPDGIINGLSGGGTGVAAVAYTNSFGRDLTVAGPTTLYSIDATTNALYIQNPPNSGTMTQALPITLGGSPLDVTTQLGFDLSAVNVTASNSPANNQGSMVATVGGTTALYRLDLSTGAATNLGTIGAGATPLSSLSIFTAPVLAVSLQGGGTLFSGFSSLDFGTVYVGETAVQKTITIGNSSAQLLNYSGTLQNGIAYSITAGASGVSGGASTLTLSFSPSSVAPFSDTLTILTNDPAAPVFTLALTGTGGLLLTDDAIAVTGSDAPLYVLANDGLDENASISSVSDAAITIDGRRLIIPGGYVGTFTYLATDGSQTGRATVTVTAGTAVVNPLAFNGILSTAGGDFVGFATVSISAKGIASISISGGIVAVKTKITVPTVGSSGTSYTSLGNVTLTRNADGTVSLSIGAFGGPIAGTLRATLTTAAIGKHHIALASPDPLIPGGGYAIATVKAKGQVTITGLLPDGLPFSAATALREDGSFSFYAVIKKANPPAIVIGELVTADLTTTDVTGELSWLKLPQVTKVKGLHFTGVDTTLTANGSLYTGLAPLPDGAGTLQLSGGNLTLTESNSVTITAGVPAFPTLSLVEWKKAGIKAGTFTTKVTVPTLLLKPVKGSGLYLPKSNRAWGFFPGTTEGGRILLTVP